MGINAIATIATAVAAIFGPRLAYILWPRSGSAPPTILRYSQCIIGVSRRRGGGGDVYLLATVFPADADAANTS